MISAHNRNGITEIVVEDDGVGMSSVQLEMLERDQASGIGFRNVNRRLQMLYNLRLEISSVQGKGTRVKLTVPEVRNVESNAG